MATVASALDGASNEDAPALLAHVLGRNRAWLIAHGADELGEQQRMAFAALCARRSAGEPLAYLVGAAGFYGREFTVDANVLVPRPETEHLIDEALAFLRPQAGPRIVDVGTGSGAIACTLAAELPAARVDAVDISLEALRVARENALRLRVGDRVRFFRGYLLQPVSGNRYDCVLANLPYVPSADIAPRPDPVSFEPRLALDGGRDGLDLYRALLNEVTSVLVPGGCLLLEAAPPIMDALEKCVREAFPECSTVVGNDYGGRARFIRTIA